MNVTRFVAAMLVAVLGVGAHAAGKVTVEPKASATANAAAVSADDIRLSKDVTYEARQKRLYQIAKDLSDATGVTILAGRNGADWQTRDLPLTIYAKQLPLGKLLNAVADCAHVRLLVSKERETRVYRFIGSTNARNAMEAYEAAKSNALKEIAKWDWDQAAKLKDVPESDFGIPAEDTAGQKRLAQARGVSALLSELGPSVRDRVIAGEEYSVRRANTSGAAREALDRIMRGGPQLGGFTILSTSTIDQRGNAAIRAVGAEASAAVPIQDKSGVTLSLARYGRDPELGVNIDFPQTNTVTGTGIVETTSQSEQCYLYEDVAKLAERAKGHEPAERPRVPDSPSISDSEKHLPLLSETGESDPAFLGAKVKLDTPKDLKSPTTADLLVALAKAGGASIVCEDFQTHLIFFGDARFPSSEKTVGDVLRSLNGSIRGADMRASYGFDWRVDAGSRLLLGSAREWPVRHANLVPESLLVGFETALGSSGVDFDDLAPVANLTEGQISDWLMRSKSLRPLSSQVHLARNHKIRAFYYGLTARDSALAKSEAGLPMATFESGVLDSLAVELCGKAFSSADREWLTSAKFTVYQVPVKDMPRVISRVGSDSPRASVSAVSISAGGTASVVLPSPPPTTSDAPATGKHTYYLTVLGKKDGVNSEHTSASEVFPIYSPEREAELAKAGK